MSYNGWSNYETWLINSHFFEDFILDEEIDFLDLEKVNSKEELIHEVKERIETYVDCYVDSLELDLSDNAFLSDIIQAFLSEVNFYEIAVKHLDSIPDDISEIKELYNTTNINDVSIAEGA